MRPALKNPKTVDAYIAAWPPVAQVMMRQLRKAIKSTAPQAQEMISYKIPFYQYKSPGYKGRMVYFAGATKHIGLYIVPEHLSPALEKQVARYRSGRSTLQFPLGIKIPIGLIKKLVKIRMKEIDAVLRGPLK